MPKENMLISSIEELYTISKDKLIGEHGSISINFANRSHVSASNDIVGNCLQEWLPDWFHYLGVSIKPGPSTQVFPDFVAEFNDQAYEVEIKAWNCNNNPAFDIANFYSFLETTYEKPNKINANYFILGYKPASDNFAEGFTLEKLYLKKLYQICGPSKKYPLNIQVKRNQPYAIRPISFYKEAPKSFNSPTEFIQAVKETFIMFPNPRIAFTPEEWATRVLSMLDKDDQIAIR